MPNGLSEKHDIDWYLQRFKTRQSKSRSFQEMVMSKLQRKRPDCSIEHFHPTGTQTNIDYFNPDGFCGNCIQYLMLCVAATITVLVDRYDPL